MNKEEIISRIEEINQTRFSNLANKNIISVSKIEEYISEQFNAKQKAEECAMKGKDNPKYKYTGMTAEEILQQWNDKAEESKRYGKLLDEYTDFRLNNKNTELEIWKLDNNFLSDDRLKNICLGFDQFYEDITGFDFEFISRELTLYGECEPDNVMPFDDGMTKNNVVIGRLDCLWKNRKTNKFLIVDWKTTDEIKCSSFRGKTMKGPAYHWEDCDMSKYTFQVHTYKNDLLNTYHITDKPENITVCICNLLKSPDEVNGKNYRVYKENFTFNSDILKQVVNFAVMKRELIKKTQ